MSAAVREATAADLPAVLALYAQPELDAGAALPLAEAEAVFARMRAYPDYRLYVAELDGRVVGTFTLIVMENLSHCGASSGLVESVVVAAPHRGRGIGAVMMEHARRHCRARGCYKMALSSNTARGRAHAFYDRLGFERHGYSFRVTP